MPTTQLHPNQLAKAKAAYVTHRVDFTDITAYEHGGNVAPHISDLVIARVDLVGHHRHIELVSGRRATLYPGDEIIVCYGNRYSPDQFEGEVPSDLSPCHLVAAGGIAAHELSHHARITLPPTGITPLGILLHKDGHRANLRDYALPAAAETNGTHPITFAVVGSSMNAGKTTTVASLIFGLVKSGVRVGAAKITGTGAGPDIWLMRDAGADPVVDFTYAGYPTTYKVPLTDLYSAIKNLIAHVASTGAEVIVLEVADGVYQRETSELISSTWFRELVDGVLFAVSGSLGATAGTKWLLDHDLPVFALSGMISASPLASREAQASTGLPILDIAALRDPATALLLQSQCRERVTT